IPLSEILVMFHLQHCSKTILKKCTVSEVRRVYYAKQYMTAMDPVVFKEPIHGVDVQTTDIFMNMLQKLQEQNIPVLILTTNLEHALLLSETTYKLKNTGLQQIETMNEANPELGSSEKQSPST